MNHPLKGITVLALVILMIGSAWAQSKRGPSTAEERTKAVNVARLLESDPLSKDAKQLREWFTLWLIEVPDISVQVCGAYLGPEFGSKKEYGTELLMQTMFSSAAFLIEHPDQAKEQVTVNQAGLEGALRAYEAILITKPKARSAFLDDLIAKSKRGELRGYVQQVAATKCVKN